MGVVSFCLVNIVSGQVNERVLYSFGGASSDGRSPCKVVQGGDGFLYGATEIGGNNNAGTLFKINSDGAGYSILHAFTTNNASDGAFPVGDMVLSSNGWLCGVTAYGGTANAGTVYRIRTNGTGFKILHSFTLHKGLSYGETDFPRNLIQGRDGNLYGVIEGASGGFSGAVFRLSISGGDYSEIHLFRSTATPDLSAPVGGLAQGRDGALYGTTLAGSLTGTNYTGGGIYKLNPDGTGYSILYLFGYDSATVPYPSSYATTTLIQGEDSALYGTTIAGGTNALGTIFKLNTNGAGYTQLYSFTTEGVDHNSVSASALVQGKDGALYGTTLAGGQGNAFRIKTNGTDFQVLWKFAAESGYDAEVPSSGLILGSDQSFYGVSLAGGDPGYGTVFKLTPPSGALAVLHSFEANATDGAAPGIALAQAADGTLYGATSSGGNGGANDGSGTLFKIIPTGLSYAPFYLFSADGTTGKWPAGPGFGRDGGLYGSASGGSNRVGVLYRINPDGTGYQILHTFATNNLDGQYPTGTPIQGPDGALYGITAYGGNLSTRTGPPGYGTIYTIRTNGTHYEVLYRFSTNTLLGAYPTGSLTQGPDGTLYGIGFGGSNGWGFVYQLNTHGTDYKVIYNFLATGADGRQPRALILGNDGWFYGITTYGGSNNAGTVFTLHPSGEGYAQLYAFSTNGLDGQSPSGLRQGRDDTLYGATHNGGANGLGTVFSIKTNGTEYLIVYSFTSSEGSYPIGAPIEGSDGALYGTLSGGGANAYGTVYRLAIRSSQFTSLRMPASKHFQFFVNGGALSYRIDVSTNLLDWTPLTNAQNVIGSIPVTDPLAAGNPRRFYRAVWTPY